MTQKLPSAGGRFERLGGGELKQIEPPTKPRTKTPEGVAKPKGKPAKTPKKEG